MIVHPHGDHMMGNLILPPKDGTLSERVCSVSVLMRVRRGKRKVARLNPM